MASEWQTVWSSEQELNSVLVTSENQIFAALYDGEILDLGKTDDDEIKAKLLLRTGGHPNSIGIDKNSRFYICDFGHSALLTTAKGNIVKLIHEFEERPLLGPNCVQIDGNGNIYFTDSGPIGTTALDNAIGSVFMASLVGGSADQKAGRYVLQPLLKDCLAHPSGIAVSNDGDTLYVAETMRNRVLRGVRMAGAFHFSVFYQFSGMLGPSCLALGKDGTLFVGRIDSPKVVLGQIAALSPTGSLIRSIPCPSASIKGISLDSENKFLFVSIGGGKVLKTKL